MARKGGSARRSAVQQLVMGWPVNVERSGRDFGEHLKRYFLSRFDQLSAGTPQQVRLKVTQHICSTNSSSHLKQELQYVEKLLVVASAILLLSSCTHL